MLPSTSWSLHVLPAHDDYIKTLILVAVSKKINSVT